MSQIQFFKPQINAINSFQFGRLSAENGSLCIEIKKRKKGVEKHDFNAFFHIWEKVFKSRGISQVDEVKAQLSELREKLIAKINKDRGFMRGMSGEELDLLDRYFAYAVDLAEIPAQGMVFQLLKNAFKLGALGVIASGVYLSGVYPAASVSRSHG